MSKFLDFMDGIDEKHDCFNTVRVFSNVDSAYACLECYQEVSLYLLMMYGEFKVELMNKKVPIKDLCGDCGGPLDGCDCVVTVVTNGRGEVVHRDTKGWRPDD